MKLSALAMCFTLLFVLSANTSFAQNRMKNVKLSNWSLGLHMGIPYTYFDIGTVVTPLYGLDVNYRIDNYLSLQLNANAGDFKSDHRLTWFGREFKNNFYQLSLQPQLNLTRLFNGDTPQRFYMYAFAGIGFIHNNVKTSIDPNLAISHGTIPAPFLGRGLHKPGLMFPAGLNMKYFVSNNVALDLGVQYNFTTADNLDGYEKVTGYVADKNNNMKDKSFYFQAGVSFNISRLFSSHHQSTGYDASSDGLINYYHSASMVKNDTTITRGKLTKLVRSQNELSRTRRQIDSLQNMISTKVAQYRNHNVSLRNQIATLQAKVDTLMNENKKLYSLTSRFYVVDGAFYSETRAHQLASELKGKGYADATVIEQNKTWNLVSVHQYDNLQSALNKMRTLRQSLNPETWVYIKW